MINKYFHWCSYPTSVYDMHKLRKGSNACIRVCREKEEYFSVGLKYIFLVIQHLREWMDGLKSKICLRLCSIFMSGVMMEVTARLREQGV